MDLSGDIAAASGAFPTRIDCSNFSVLVLTTSTRFEFVLTRYNPPRDSSRTSSEGCDMLEVDDLAERRGLLGNLGLRDGGKERNNDKKDIKSVLFIFPEISYCRRTIQTTPDLTVPYRWAHVLTS